MVAAFPVLRFVVDGVPLDLHLADGEVALEVGAVVHRVPETELDVGIELYAPHALAAVLYRYTHQKTGVPSRHEQLLRHVYPVLLALQHRIPEAVAAGIAVRLGLYRLPAGIPDGRPVPDVDMKAVRVQRRGVVPIPRQPPQTGVPVKGVAARRVRQQHEEVLAAEIIDPRQGRPRRGDHILPPLVVKMSEPHPSHLLLARSFL